jgi:hypothetical protein
MQQHVDGPDRRERASEMATALCRGFVAHDNGEREEAIEAFSTVDRNQFPKLDDGDVRLAATAFVDALWAKDDIEFRHLSEGEFDRDGIREASYSPVKRELRKRAAIVGADPRYAETKATAWRRHKAGGDYWTPFLRSQIYEVRAAIDEPEYPNKPRSGVSGPGPEPMRYMLAFELHDMRTEAHWKQGIDVMIPYFERILEEHRDESG